jgi:manganese transport protein
MVLVPHVRDLARRLGAKLVLLHVADGFAARNFVQLHLAESEEMRSDRRHLEVVAAGLRADGIEVETELALGNPPTEIIRSAAAQRCDLIAMAAHGHKLIGDLSGEHD